MKKILMKYEEIFVAILFIILLLILSLFCSCSPRNPIVEPAEKFIQTVGVEYLDYVEQDERLDESAKRSRKLNVEAFKRLIQEAGQ